MEIICYDKNAAETRSQQKACQSPAGEQNGASPAPERNHEKWLLNSVKLLNKPSVRRKPLQAMLVRLPPRKRRHLILVRRTRMLLSLLPLAKQTTMLGDF
jgi:hypothetical protein